MKNLMMLLLLSVNNTFTSSNEKEIIFPNNNEKNSLLKKSIEISWGSPYNLATQEHKKRFFIETKKQLYEKNQLLIKTFETAHKNKELDQNDINTMLTTWEFILEKMPNIVKKKEDETIKQVFHLSKNFHTDKSIKNKATILNNIIKNDNKFKALLLLYNYSNFCCLCCVKRNIGNEIEFLGLNKVASYVLQLAQDSLNYDGITIEQIHALKNTFGKLFRKEILLEITEFLPESIFQGEKQDINQYVLSKKYL